ncbi:hypothetical protein [Neomoorella mulderi]|nr:hypothetical protein [Moorella mulderi]
MVKEYLKGLPPPPGRRGKGKVRATGVLDTSEQYTNLKLDFYFGGIKMC